MSINDIHDAIEHQDVWSSWSIAARDNAKAERKRDDATRKKQRVFG